MLAGSGAGIAILPTRVVKAMVANLRRLEKYPHYTDKVTFVYRADLPKTASSKYIVELMKSIVI
jgi:DNA-binding transcriptional LysR family regulator